MKFVLITCVCVAVVFAQDPAGVVAPKPATRNLPADVLRDFPGACFASTACRVFQAGESWPLKPFCGRATCLKSETNQLVERVEDCGLRPKESPGCEVINEADLEKDFPLCCPQYICEQGSELLYPTEAEIKAEAEKAAAAQRAAAEAAAAEAAAAQNPGA